MVGGNGSSASRWVQWAIGIQFTAIVAVVGWLLYLQQSIQDASKVERIARNESVLGAHEYRIQALERPGGATVMAETTRQRFESVERGQQEIMGRLQRVEDRCCWRRSP